MAERRNHAEVQAKMDKDQFINSLVEENAQLEEACLILMANNQKLTAQIEAIRASQGRAEARPQNATIN